MIKERRGLFVAVLFCMLLACCSPERSVETMTAAGEPPGRWDDGMERYRKSWPEEFHIGRSATKAFIDKWDIDVRPDGKGLPEKGAGLAKTGALLYANKCASCHGKNGQEGPYDKLVVDGTASKTIGNYWPYATTIFDYVRRAMPLNAPGSLSDQEVYDLTAYLLYRNDIIKQNDVIDYRSLPAIKMPAKDRFVVDDRRGGKEIK